MTNVTKGVRTPPMSDGMRDRSIDLMMMTVIMRVAVKLTW
jgi:hypothetical protein